MPSSFFFMLGFVVATVIAQEQTSENVTVPGLHSSIITTNPMSTTISSVTPTINTSNSDAEINVSTESSTAEPFGTTLPSGQSATEATRAPMLQTTPAPGSSATKALSPTTKATLQKSSTPSPQRDSSDKTGIIILVILILVAVVFLIACYVTQKRRRRYSVDSSRQDEVNIPLSTVEPVDTAPQNGLKTFESTETTEKKPEEPEAKPEATDEAKPEKQEEQKAETDKSVADPSTESATPTPAPAPDSSEDKPKADVPEQSPPAPVESTVEVKTDDEAAVSNKTSVESLKGTNENNSNNAGFIQTRNLIFWDVPLDCPV